MNFKKATFKLYANITDQASSEMSEETSSVETLNSKFTEALEKSIIRVSPQRM